MQQYMVNIQKHQRRSTHTIKNSIYTDSQLLPLLIFVKKPKMSGHRLTQSEFTIQNSMEYFCDLIIQFEEQELTYISVVIIHFVDISKMDFSHWQPPGVSERMCSVHLDASISGEYQTQGGHSEWPWE